MAAKVAADAVIEADHDSGISFTAGKSLKASRLAVKRMSDEVVCAARAVCAEAIKAAAIECRYGGAERPLSVPTRVVSAPTEAVATRPVEQAPPRDNSPAIVIGPIVVAVNLVLSARGPLAHRGSQPGGAGHRPC